MTRAILFASMVATLACTANVQDLGTPEPPTAPLVSQDHACAKWPLHGQPCSASDPPVCNPRSTLQCVCGYDGTWVCLDATLGLLSPHAIGDGDSCQTGVTYRDGTLFCTCDVGQLTCRPYAIDRPSPESEHAP